MFHPSALNHNLIESIRAAVAWLETMSEDELAGFCDELRGATNPASQPCTSGVLNAYRQAALTVLDGKVRATEKEKS